MVLEHIASRLTQGETMNLLSIAVKVGWPTDEELSKAKDEAEAVI
jgi:hypothetical protein